MSVSHRGLEGLRCKELCGVVCEILKDRGAQFDFTAAFCNALTHFEGCEFSQLALPFKQKLGGAGNNLCALFDWECCPRHKSLVRGGQGVHHFLIGVLCEGLKNFSSSWIYAAIWHGELLCSSRDSRPPHRISRHASSKRRVGLSWNEIFQQVNSVMVAIHQSSINYIFLVDEASPTVAHFALIEHALARANQFESPASFSAITTRNM
jgi:hypothetical protein